MDRPILFSGPMVRALLAGTKTQTRRACKPQPSQVTGSGTRVYPDADFKKAWRGPGGCDQSMESYADCPYYRSPGDRLWVRETWRPDLVTSDGEWQGPAHYRASDDPAGQGKWRPSIHMPRWASRITLDITGVRVERLSDIRFADILAEGISRYADETLYLNGMAAVNGPRGAYATLWESINGPGSWDLNPWVWVVSFKRAVTP